MKASNVARRVRTEPERLWLQPERFTNEAIYCAAEIDNDAEILCRGTEDDTYKNPAERRMRFEKQAQRFIDGQPMLIFSASLKGPFDKESGWKNPWRSRSLKRKAEDEVPAPTARKKQARTKEPAAQTPAPMEHHNTSSHIQKRNTGDSSAVVSGSSFRYLDEESASRILTWNESVLIDPADEATPPQDDILQHTPTPCEKAPYRLPVLSSLPMQEKRTQEPGLQSSQIQNKVVRSSQPASSSQPGDQRSRLLRNDEPVPRKNGKLRPSIKDTPARNVSADDDEPLATKLTQKRTSTAKEAKPVRTTENTASASRRDKSIVAPAASTATGLSTLLTTLDIDEVDPVATQIHEAAVQYVDTNKTLVQTPAQRAGFSKATAARSTGQGVADISYQTLSDESFRFKSRRPRKAPVRHSPVVVRQDEHHNELKNVEEIPHASIPADDGRAVKLTPHPASIKHVEQRTTQAPDSQRQQAQAGGEHEREAAYTTQPDEVPDAGQLEVAEPKESAVYHASAPSTQNPRVAAAGSSFKQGAPGLLSLGTFSWERQESQSSFLANMPTMPRKLLWPRSQRQAEEEAQSDPISLPPFEWDGPQPDFSSVTESPKPSQAQPSQTRHPHAETPQRNLDGHTATLIEPPGKTPMAAQARNSTGGMIHEINVDDSHAAATITLIAPDSHQDRNSPPAGPVIELGSPVKSDNQTVKNELPVITLGSPMRLTGQVSVPADTSPATRSRSPAQSESTTSTHQQSLCSTKSANSPQHAIEEPVLENFAPGPADIVDEGPSKLQSPWADHFEGAPLMVKAASQPTAPASESQRRSQTANHPLGSMSQRSPWARGDSQFTSMAPPRLFNPLSSPSLSPRLPETIPSELPSALPLPSTEEPPHSPLPPSTSPPPPSTPTRYKSSLPTPEFTLSIKSFREFMTPSPIKHRTPLGPTDSNGRFPSTQALASAAASNPWTRPSSRKKKTAKRRSPTQAKRVSWGPLPGEEEPPSSPVAAEYLAHNTSSPLRHHSRPASPPPSSLIAPGDIPGENQKFGKHFAAVVAKRRRQSGFLARRRSSLSGGGATPLMRPAVSRGVSLLPSASQQLCESPGLEAMAERFREADERTRAYSEGVESARADGIEDDGGVEGEGEGYGDEGGAEAEIETQDTEDDPVREVLDNLDSFLGTWDIDAELAEKRTESERQERERREKEEGMFGAAAELMDFGVWN